MKAEGSWGPEEDRLARVAQEGPGGTLLSLQFSAKGKTQ